MIFISVEFSLAKIVKRTFYNCDRVIRYESGRYSESPAVQPLHHLIATRPSIMSTKKNM